MLGVRCSEDKHNGSCLRWLSLCCVVLLPFPFPPVLYPIYTPVTMHFVTALTLAASASTLVSARLDHVRRHGDSSVGAPHLAARAPVPEPFRLFPAPGASENPQSGPVSHDALEALLAPVHPARSFQDAPELSKRSDSPKKGSKCHKKKRPASTKKSADKSAGQILAAAPKSDSDSKKEAAPRQTWAERQRGVDSKKAVDDEHKAKDDAKTFTSDDSKQLAATHKSSDKGEEKKDKEKTDSLPVFDGGAKVSRSTCLAFPAEKPWSVGPVSYVQIIWIDAFLVILPEQGPHRVHHVQLRTEWRYRRSAERFRIVPRVRHQQEQPVVGVEGPRGRHHRHHQDSLDRARSRDQLGVGTLQAVYPAL